MAIISAVLVVLAAPMLKNNRYASDQTLFDYVAILYAAHTSVPLLVAYLLPTLAFPCMLDSKRHAARETDLLVKDAPFPVQSQQSRLHN